jgi:periplasmic copper chaperone A
MRNQIAAKGFVSCYGQKRASMKTFLYALRMLSIASLSSSVFAELIVEGAHVRGLPPGVDTTSAYMTLRNTGDTAVEITGATSPVAGEVTLHTTMNHNGMLHMQHLMSASVPAHGELVFESGGLHLMLAGLNQALVIGAEVELTLQFADGTTQQLSLPVRSVLDE